MGKPKAVVTVQVFDSIRMIEAEAWSKLAPADFPFASYHFLSALETTGCLGIRTGWEPRILTAWVGKDLMGALISFVKTNSYGEYIFDFAWAQAFEQSGLPYYPKLTAAIPFTPASGPKILVSYDQEAHPFANVQETLIEAWGRLGADLGVSSAHALFLNHAELEAFEHSDFFARHSFQFHWHNQDYKVFTDFLAALKSKRRKEILRERAQVQSARVRIQRLTGDLIKTEHASLFYDFYMSTIDKNSSYDYLTAEFFGQVFSTMKENLLLVLAFDEQGRTVAGALNFIGTSTLFGRYWGCLAEYRALHFELCYYQGIEFAIEKGLTKFEAGAQGEHKFQRGFIPSLTLSAHQIHHPVLNHAIRDHVAYEKKQVARVMQRYMEHDPYRAAEEKT